MDLCFSLYRSAIEDKLCFYVEKISRLERKKETIQISTPVNSQNICFPRHPVILAVLFDVFLAQPTESPQIYRVRPNTVLWARGGQSWARVMA